MERQISCEFNIDTACVEVKYADGSMISIDCTKVENEVARNMYEASELDWLVYNAPVDYVNLPRHDKKNPWWFGVDVLTYCIGVGAQVRFLLLFVEWYGILFVMLPVTVGGWPLFSGAASCPQTHGRGCCSWLHILT